MSEKEWSPHIQEEMERLDEERASEMIGRKVTKMKKITMGFNNLTFKVTAEKPEGGGSEDIALRLTSKKTWPKAKVSGEVGAIQFIRRRTTIPVPDVISFDAEGRDFGFMFIAERWIEGESLLEEWKKMTAVKQEETMREVVGQLGQLQSIKFDRARGQLDPGSIEPGRLGPDPPTLVRHFSSGQIGCEEPMPRGTLGYFEECVKEKGRALLECGDPMLSSQSVFVERLHTVLERSAGLREALDSVPIVATHGDLSARNFIIDPASGKITGLLDWEWFGSFPANCDWANGFDDFQLPPPSPSPLTSGSSGCGENKMGPSSKRTNWTAALEIGRQMGLFGKGSKGFEEACAVGDVIDAVMPWNYGIGYGRESDERTLSEARSVCDEVLCALESRFL